MPKFQVMSHRLTMVTYPYSMDLGMTETQSPPPSTHSPDQRLMAIPRVILKPEKSMPFPVYDKDQSMIVQKGQTFSDSQTELLESQVPLFTHAHELVTALSRGDNIVGFPTEATLAEEKKRAAAKIPSPFLRLNQLESDLRCVITGSLYTSDFTATIHRLIDRLHNINTDAADCALATIFLHGEHNDACKRSLNVAIIIDLLAREIHLNLEDHQALVAAAMTMDIGYLYAEADDKHHSTYSAELLQALGVDDVKWLEFVGKHHEHYDGSGQPAALTCDYIPLGAIVLNLVIGYCERFAGQYTQTEQRQIAAIPAFFQDNDPRYKGIFKILLLKVLGYYPPGKLVILKNHDVGVVLRRGMEPDTAKIRCVANMKSETNAVNQMYHADPKLNPIVDIVSAEKMPPQINIEALWGFAERKKMA